MTKLLCVISDTDMRCRHEGLLVQAKKAGVEVDKLQPGVVVAFLNTAKDRLMILTKRGVDDKYGILAYYRSPHGRIMPEAIQYIPESFNGEHFDMNKATLKGLEGLLRKKRIKKGEQDKKS